MARSAPSQSTGRMLSPVVDDHAPSGAATGVVAMTRLTKLSMIAIALATFGTSVTGASADTLWQYNHPRRAEVNERLAHQNFRIDRAEANGRISPFRAERLHAEDHAIRRAERIIARVHGGGISP